MLRRPLRLPLFPYTTLFRSVAGEEGGPPRKIFQPGPDVLATSTPLWSPDGRRLLFTTARDRSGRPAQPAAADDPDGNRYGGLRSEEHTSELQSLRHLVCRLL